MPHPKSLADRMSITLLVVAAIAVALVGCSSDPQWVSVRSVDSNPYARPLEMLVSSETPQASPRTEQLLRLYDLSARVDDERSAVINELATHAAPETRHAHEHAMAELAYLGAKKAEGGDRDRAVALYGDALLHSYRYLFDPSGGVCNPYDPQFRGACDLYNKSLEGLLRLALKQDSLRPGDHRTVHADGKVCSFDVVLQSSGWHADDVDRFEFVSDYRLTGLRNHYHTYGLGVPLIAIRKPHPDSDPAEEHYPSNLAFPLTAFLRVSDPVHGPTADPDATPGSPRFTLELHDPFDNQQLVVNGRPAPLESDLSTPLAYFLAELEKMERPVSTLGLLRPEKLAELQGLYMLEPYDPKKMPVLMVHGLWSSPITWMEMYNDLRSDPQLRDRYQFWSYLYPTGQPFWVSAAQLRRELEETRAKLDPGHRAPALDQMVLVGHSMGGLVSKLQSVDSGHDFWRINTDRSFQELNIEPENYSRLAKAYFFRPNPSVRRVVTIGTPHRGSSFSNGFTQWLGSQLIDSPMRLVKGREQLLRDNPDYFRPNSTLEIRTSIDSLSRDSPILPVLLNAKPGPWVTYHNIMGRQTDSLINEIINEDGDGVVTVYSASIEDLPQVASQITVAADHVSVHRHPQSVLEVRRILLEQLAELENLPYANRVRTASQPPDNIAVRRR